MPSYLNMSPPRNASARVQCNQIYIRCLAKWKGTETKKIMAYMEALYRSLTCITTKTMVNFTQDQLVFSPKSVHQWFLIDSSPLCVYNNLGYLVLFQSKHSCFWCSLISVSIGQHVSTLLFLGHHQVSPFFVCGSFSTFCNATYSRCLFLHMVKIHSYG